MFSFKTIFSDTINFIRNNFTIILVTLFAIAMVTQLVNWLFYPSQDVVNELTFFVDDITKKYGSLSADSIVNAANSLSESEKARISSIGMSYLAKIAIITTSVMILSNGVMLSLIFNLSYKQLSITNLWRNFLRISISLILFILFCLVAFMAMLLIISLLPGLSSPIMLVAMLFYLQFYLVFLAVIIEPNQQPITVKMIKTWRFLKQQFKFIIPIIGVWFIGTFVVSILNSVLSENLVFDVLLTMLNLLLNFSVILYTYRLFMLTNR